ncbi:MAG: type II toxin-antitoxin system VapC family toxin [Acidobacteria bacterium]|jgi:predicted nucleic acid-binding protein|nr:type II toxin-antitoxin system VapC family toxin [Acidobacteriota bacterium]
MEECLLIDSDVLIDYLRGHPAAISYLEGLTERQIVSVMTVAELYTGIREGNERQALEELLKTFEIIPVNEKTAILGGLFRRTFLKSHGVGIADAVIAATAEVESATLATLNKKHFPMLSKVIVPYRKS